MNEYYPYQKVQNFNQLTNSEYVPKMVTDYLLDLPQAGYNPPDNNGYPRSRLIKYLYYDGERPLSNPIPTVQEKLSIVYDPYNPGTPPNAEKGYRIFPLTYPSQAQVIGQTIIRMFYGRAIASTDFRADQSFVFEIMSSTSYENNTKTEVLSRTYAIAMDIVRALNGVNMSGVGTWYFDRRQHGDCGITPISDEGVNVGYRLTMAYTVM